MSCCGGPNAGSIAGKAGEISEHVRSEELRHAGKTLEDGSVQFVFSVPEVKCGACISTIERHIGAMEGVLSCRVNLTLRRVTVILHSDETSPLDIVRKMEAIGYKPTPFDIGDLEEHEGDKDSKALLRALAVAGFASSNIMLLSVSVWSGADGATRDLFHLISALIAIPAVLYAGQVFFRSAWSVLRNGHVNMDVPISLAISLATGMSLYESLTGGEEAYFEASTMLLFFLLIGRYLDQRMRERARTAVVQLSRLSAKGANLVRPDGETVYVTLDEISKGMTVRVFPGDRVPVDGMVETGSSDVDRSLVSGESMPVSAAPGMVLEAGSMNLTGVLDLKVVNTADQSFLAEVHHMMEAAENGRGAYVRIADRMARLYAPFVHSMAALAFVTWMVFTGDWHTSLYVAIALLIITCPCALGLAVPAVHVIGAARLLENGILMKDGAALERLAEADAVVLDKTGTLTTGEAHVAESAIEKPADIRMARALAGASGHPAARALVRYLGEGTRASLASMNETPGCGVEGLFKGSRVRLGRLSWVSEIAGGDNLPSEESGLAFCFEGRKPLSVTLGEELREGVEQTIAALKDWQMPVEILSGDATAPVAAMADELGIENWKAARTPAGKIERIEELREKGAKVLVVGDGINDAPALAAGHVSMAPSSGSDVGRMAADFVFTRDGLDAVPTAIAISRRARTLVRQNFTLAALYNFIAIPIAFAGYVTPLVAAVAMSASSIVVVANSLRLARKDGGQTLAPSAAGAHGRKNVQKRPSPVPQVSGKLL